MTFSVASSLSCQWLRVSLKYRILQDDDIKFCDLVVSMLEESNLVGDELRKLEQHLTQKKDTQLRVLADKQHRQHV